MFESFKTGGLLLDPSPFEDPLHSGVIEPLWVLAVLRIGELRQVDIQRETNACGQSDPLQKAATGQIRSPIWTIGLTLTIAVVTAESVAKIPATARRPSDARVAAFCR